MARYTITPWKHPSDLLIVRQQLYRLNTNHEEDLRRHACNRIMAWKLRSNLPHAVESTALLIDSQLHHQNATSSSDQTGLEISDFSIRAVYAAAFTRFVTGFCDIGRSRERGLEQSSMLAIAKQIGMPLDFVALRHEATHEELPGLRRLVQAVERGLEWLWGVYWAKLEEPVAKVGMKGDGKVDAEMVRTLRQFRRERRETLKRAKRNQGDGGKELVLRVGEGCIASYDSKREAGVSVSKALLLDRLLLPTTRNLGDSLDGAYLIWDLLLQYFSTNLPNFAQQLVSWLFAAMTKVGEMRPERDSDKEAYSFWLLHLTETIASDQQDFVLQQCCLYPGYWTQHIGRRILGEGKDELREAWASILEASLLVTGTNDSATKEGELENMNAMDVDAASIMESSGRWTRAVVPPALPIGVV